MIAETDIGRAVVAYLEDLHWDVYQEVQPTQGVGAIADVVAVQGPVLWVVELKKSLTFDVIAQADRWHRWAHRVSVAVPLTKRWSAGRELAARVLDWKGIGYLPVGSWFDGLAVRDFEARQGRLNRHADAARLRGALCPEHKTYAPAGNAEGRRWSPFQRTCQDVRDKVAGNPGIHLSALINAISHHYASDASARSSLSHWIQAGKVPGVEARREGRFLRIYPEANP